MRLLLGSFMLLHALAHGVGFAAAFRLTRDYAFRPSVMNGRVDIGDVGMRMVGISWLIAGGLFGFAGLAALTAQPIWLPVAIIALTLSSILCVFQFRDARVGFYINLAIALLLTLGARLGWLV